MYLVATMVAVEVCEHDLVGIRHEGVYLYAREPADLVEFSFIPDEYGPGVAAFSNAGS